MNTNRRASAYALGTFPSAYARAPSVNRPNAPSPSGAIAASSTSTPATHSKPAPGSIRSPVAAQKHQAFSRFFFSSFFFFPAAAAADASSLASAWRCRAPTFGARDVAISPRRVSASAPATASCVGEAIGQSNVLPVKH